MHCLSALGLLQLSECTGPLQTSREFLDTPVDASDGWRLCCKRCTAGLAAPSPDANQECCRRPAITAVDCPWTPTWAHNLRVNMSRVYNLVHSRTSPASRHTCLAYTCCIACSC